MNRRKSNTGPGRRPSRRAAATWDIRPFVSPYAFVRLLLRAAPNSFGNVCSRCGCGDTPYLSLVLCDLLCSVCNSHSCVLISRSEAAKLTQAVAVHDSCANYSRATRIDALLLWETIYIH